MGMLWVANASKLDKKNGLNSLARKGSIFSFFPDK
jgi:hypothetical protein